MRTILLSDNDEILLREAIRNQIDLLDDLPVLMQDEIESRELCRSCLQDFGIRCVMNYGR